MPDDEKRADLFQKLAPDAVGFTYTAPPANPIVSATAPVAGAVKGKTKDGKEAWFVKKPDGGYQLVAE